MATVAVAVGAILAIALFAVHATVSFARSQERRWQGREKSWDTERKELLDRVMYLSDKPWSPPPLDQAEPSYLDPWADLVNPETEVID